MASRSLGDPYVEWSLATAFVGHQAIEGPASPVPVLCEARSALRGPLPAGACVPGAYRPGERFFTAQVPSAQLAAFEAGVKGLEMALPAAAGPVDETAPAPGPAARRPVLAVIDRDCAFLNEVFRDGDGRTRLIALWQQSQRASAPWRVPAGFGYGRELTGHAIDAMLERLGHGAAGEADLYREAGYLIDTNDELLSASHGTHVFDTLSGRIDGNPPAASAKPMHNDAAAAAPLIFVEPPRPLANDHTGAGLGAYWLDALHYIRMKAGPGVDVVVNISMGALAGPHDGSSLTERAIDRFLDDDGHMQVVVAAGNSAQEPWHVDGVLAAAGAATGAQAAFSWRIQPGDDTDSYCELWFAPQKGRRSALDLEVQLTDPLGRRSGWSSLTQTGRIEDDGQLLALVIGRPAGRAGGRDAMVLLAMAPSSGSGARALASPGLWRIDVRNRSAVGVKFDAWVQRDDPGRRTSGEVQSYFQAVLAGQLEIDGKGSLSSLATARRVVVIGSANLDSRQPSPYSARGIAGSTQRRRIRDIDFFAPSDAGPPGMGLWAAGIRSRTLKRMGGTSVASPIAARQIYNDRFAQLQGNAPLPSPVAQRPRLAALAKMGPKGLTRPLLAP